MKISRKPEPKGQRDKDGKHQDLQFKISTSSSESSEITIAGSAGIFLCFLLKRLRKYFSAALVTDFSNMFFIHSFHMFGMRSCVPNSLRMLCCTAKVYFATSFHARFCWFVDRVFREFNILKRELCWIWRSESPGKRDRIFAKESCLCSAALTQEDRACCSSTRTLSPKDRLHAWQNRCSRCCRIYLPVSTSNKWEDNQKLFSERPQSKPNDSAVGRGIQK